jgi:hypothetical protein
MSALHPLAARLLSKGRLIHSRASSNQSRHLLAPFFPSSPRFLASLPRLLASSPPRRILAASLPHLLLASSPPRLASSSPHRLASSPPCLASFPALILLWQKVSTTAANLCCSTQAKTLLCVTHNVLDKKKKNPKYDEMRGHLCKDCGRPGCRPDNTCILILMN